MSSFSFLEVAEHLENVGLIWHPEIGDEVLDKKTREKIAVLVDTHGLTPKELRGSYLWLPTVEQMVHQFEARQAILKHAGLELTENSFCYKTVVKAPNGEFESRGDTMRLSFGLCLRDLLVAKASNNDEGLIH